MSVPRSARAGSQERQTSNKRRAATGAPGPRPCPSTILPFAQVIRCDDGSLTDIPALWGARERAVVVWARTFGCPFCWELAMQLRRDVMPALDAQGVKLYLVASGLLAQRARRAGGRGMRPGVGAASRRGVEERAKERLRLPCRGPLLCQPSLRHPPTRPPAALAVGTYERSKDFVEATGYPADRLLADPDGGTYAALGLVKGVAQTFFSVEVRVAAWGAAGPLHAARMRACSRPHMRRTDCHAHALAWILAALACCWEEPVACAAARACHTSPRP